MSHYDSFPLILNLISYESGLGTSPTFHVFGLGKVERGPLSAVWEVDGWGLDGFLYCTISTTILYIVFTL
jgi:hypothetical protein